MNRFREEVSGFAQARWRLAAAFLLAGQTGAADMLIQQSQITTEEYPGQGATFGSELRDKAMILETLILKNDRKRAFSLLKEMAGEINDSQWLSTQTAAWCFCSISEFFGMKDYSGGIDAQVTLNGKQEKQRSELPMIKVPLEVSSDGTAGATVENTGTSPLFVRVSARGIPLEDTSGGARNDLSISAVFTDRNGKSIDPSSLPQGTDLFLNVTVSHPGTRAPYRDLVLSTIFPSGWEILNSRINDIPENQSRQFDYQDIRDDRIYTYFSLKNSESKTFRISLNASYGGKFYLPALVCEEMYDNSVYARIPGQWVKVVRQ
jgi:uncharacterized protein YfaS (alpha-2-macroglobulin family)